jgi:hypothetical protein
MAALVLWATGWGKSIQAVPVIYNCLTSLRDLEIDVNQNEESVQIYFK